jgi:hypothetical protein
LPACGQLEGALLAFGEFDGIASRLQHACYPSAQFNLLGHN